jgi:NitT/TauT family transport system permease protein
MMKESLHGVRRSAKGVPARMFYALLGIGGLIGIWQLSIVIWTLPAYLLPNPAEVGAAMLAEWRKLAAGAYVTGYEIAISFVASLGLGIVGAVALHFWPPVARLAWPVVIFAKIVPQVAIAPILIVWLGLGLATKVVVAVLLGFFPILVATYLGLSFVDDEIVELGRSMRANRLRLFYRFELPAALPHILSGAKVGMASCVIGVVVAEFLASNNGLGHLVLAALGQMDNALVLAAIIALSVEGSAFYLLVSLTEKLVMPWHISQRRTMEFA